MMGPGSFRSLETETVNIDSTQASTMDSNDFEERKSQSGRSTSGNSTRSKRSDKEQKDNPKMAIFYFVMYTLFSTYNLVSGKFLKSWYP